MYFVLIVNGARLLVLDTDIARGKNKQTIEKQILIFKISPVA